MFPLGAEELSVGMTSSRKQTKCHLSSVLLILLNLLIVVQLKATGSSEDEGFDDPEYSWDIATDNPALYNIIPMLDLDSIFEELKVDTEFDAISHPQTRRKRSSFFASNYGKQVNEKVGTIKTQNIPFSSAVRISTKCTGSLISERHVLTAAHCVHDGKRPKYKLPYLRVGFLQRNGRFHWIKVTKMFLPDGWKTSKGTRRHSLAALDSDYAVLRLKRPHGRSYFTPRRSNFYIKSPMKFNGFPSHKGGMTLWHSSCRVRKIVGQILISQCSASEGSSGSGIYVSRGRGGYGVTGIVSAAMKFRKGKQKMLLTLSTKLTPAKVKLICHWMGQN